MRENRLDDMSDDVIHRRLQTYYDETFKTLSFYPTELIFDVDAGRRTIDVLCDIANRLAAHHSKHLKATDALDARRRSATRFEPSRRSNQGHVGPRILRCAESRRANRADDAPAFSLTSRTRPSCPS